MKPEAIYVLYPVILVLCLYLLRWLPSLTNLMFSMIISFIILNLMYIPDTYSVYKEKTSIFYYSIMIVTLLVVVGYGINKGFDVVADHTILMNCDSTDPNRKCIY